MANSVSQLAVVLEDRFSGPARQIGKATSELQKSFRGVTTGPVTLVNRLDAAITRNNRALADARLGIADAVGGFYALKAAIASPIAEATAFESAMADVKKVVDFPTPKAFDDFKTALMDLSREIPLTVNGLAEIAAAAGQAGIGGADLVRFTEAAAKIGVAFDISAQESGDAMAKMMTGLGMTIDETVLLTDAINHLSNAQASSAAEVLDVVRRVGAQAKMFGYSAEEVAAFGSAMIAAGAESDVAATSFRNMGLALTKGASATKAQHNAFAELGLDQFSVAERMQKDAVGTTIDVLERLSKLPKHVQASVASDLFGNEARALGPLLTNLDLVYTSLGLVGDEANFAGSAFKEFAARNKTFGNQVQRFSNLLTNLKINIGNALLPVLSDLIKRMTPFVDQIVALASRYPSLTAGIVSATAALIGFRAALAGLSFLALMGKGGALSALSIGLRGVSAALAGFKFITMTGPLALIAGLRQLAVMPFRVVAAGVASLRTALVGLYLLGSTGGLSAVLKTMGSAILGLLSPMRIVRAAALALRVALAMSGVGLVLLGIAAAGKFIYDNWQGIKEAFEAFGQAFTAALGPAKPMLDPVISAVSSLFEWASKLSFEISPQRWREWGAAAGKTVGDVVKWFAELPGRIINAIGSIDLSKIIKWPSMPSWLGGGTVTAANPGGAVEGVTSDPMGTGAVDGQRAKGGPISKGGSYLVGEKGPELITAGRSGYVNKAGASASAGPITLNQSLHFNIQGKADEDVIEKIRRVMRDEVRETFRGVFADTGMRMA
jgi:TP901 family phage tail tape measure protein